MATLKDLEASLLSQLALSQGNILENDALLQSLSQSKKETAAIEQRLAEAKTLKDSIRAKKTAFSDFCGFASKLFFFIEDLSGLGNPMYHFNLDFFLQCYTTAFVGAESSDPVLLQKFLCREVYAQASYSLFRADRVAFALAMSQSLYNLPDQNELQLLTAPKETKTAQKFNTKSPFAEVLQASIERPQETTERLHAVLSKSLQVPSLQPALPTLPQLIAGGKSNEEGVSQAILFIVSPGQDPSKDISEYAAATSTKCVTVSLGQGQAEIALSALDEAASGGHFLVLQNVHLVTNWLLTLKQRFDASVKRKGFCLMMTSEVSGTFPSDLLKACRKVTVEAPPGLKQNLLRSVKRLSLGESRKENLALLAMCWFHGLCQERRTFIPQGWGSFYEFSNADLSSGFVLLRKAMKEGGASSWEKVKFILLNAVYGGRMDAPVDLKTLWTYLDETFQDGCFTGAKRLTMAFDMPSDTSLQAFTATFEALPEKDLMKWFGLSPNAEFILQQVGLEELERQLQVFNAKKMDSNVGKGALEKLKSVIELYVPYSGTMKEDFANKSSIGRSFLILFKIVSEFFFQSGAFLKREIQVCKALHERIGKDLKQIAAVSNGLEPSTAVTISLSKDLSAGLTPSTWDRIWTGSEVCKSYIAEVCNKTKALQSWYNQLSTLSEEGGLSSIEKLSTVSLADFFRPSVLLSAFRQVMARHCSAIFFLFFLISNVFSILSDGCALDALTLNTNTKAQQNGLQLKSLWLQGASFDGQGLQEVGVLSPSFIGLDSLCVTWDQKSKRSSEDAAVPLYQRSDRSSLVTTLYLSCSDRALRNLSGVALALKPSA